MWDSKIFRYRSDSRYTIDELENNYIYFSNYKNLDDPFDANPSLYFSPTDILEYERVLRQTYLKANSTKSKDFINNLASTGNFPKFIDSIFLPTIFEKIGIACFSRKKDLSLMWHYYSNKSKGLVFEYNPQKDYRFFKELKEVKYKKILKRKMLDLTRADYSLEKKLLEKKEQWSGQEEIRLLKNQTGKQNFNPGALISITFGVDSQSEFKDQVIEIINRKYPHVKIYQATIPIGKLNYRFEKIK